MLVLAEPVTRFGWYLGSEDVSENLVGCIWMVPTSPTRWHQRQLQNAKPPNSFAPLWPRLSGGGARSAQPKRFVLRAFAPLPNSLFVGARFARSRRTQAAVMLLFAAV